MRFLDRPPEDPGWGHARGPGTEGVRLHYVRRGSGEAVVREGDDAARSCLIMVTPDALPKDEHRS
jgi:hypothetical protein